MDMHDFHSGNSFDAYTYFGAHTYSGGTRFAVWAPNARQIDVLVDREKDSRMADVYPMKKRGSNWECRCPGVTAGMYYKYRITGADGSVVEHCDPYGRAMALRPDNRSIIVELDWNDFDDEAWMKARTKNHNSPMAIYEVHAGSWQQKEDGSLYNYEELAEILPAYVKEHGYTHIELMPLSEHPFDGSWGYQTTGFFAPTSRYGTPRQLCKLINACHKAGIGVILDFVPVHFAVDSYGLHRFDGTALYEYPHADVGQSEWGSCNFMHCRGEVSSFLRSCANYWLSQFHADGLRMDAVSRLLYWQGDVARGENYATVEFVKGMNSGLHLLHPTAMLIAEDSTSYPKVTAPVKYGGLGFDYKWDLGWMNDTLDFFKKGPLERQYNMNKLTFSMLYFPHESYLLPFSHDENVHGKATILQKMWGGYETKFPQGRILYLYMAMHPGKTLDFMGNEFGQLREWDEKRGQDWDMLRYPNHDAFNHFRAMLQQLYLKHDAFWEGEYNIDNFAWLDCSHPDLGAFAIMRTGKKTKVFAAINFMDRPVNAYPLTLPAPGKIRLLLDTDWECWGGTTPKPQRLRAKAHKGTIKLNLPPFSGQLYLMQE